LVQNTRQNCSLVVAVHTGLWTATKGFSVNFPVIANEFIAPKDARTENKLDLKNKNQKTPDVSLALNTNCTPLPN